MQTDQVVGVGGDNKPIFILAESGGQLREHREIEVVHYQPIALLAAWSHYGDGCG